MRILGIETSCDETAAAVVEDGRRVRSSIVSSQVKLHAPYGGVVPELASRAHVELINPVVDEALMEAGILDAGELDAVAACHGPGLAGALLVGVSAAQALALSTGLPYVSTPVGSRIPTSSRPSPCSSRLAATPCSSSWRTTAATG